MSTHSVVKDFQLFFFTSHSLNQLGSIFSTATQRQRSLHGRP